jgi:hypothetical protein
MIGYPTESTAGKISGSLRTITRMLLLTLVPTLVLPAINAQSMRPSTPPQIPSEQADQLVIDLSADTGAILHGASGWLYGQSAPGIPTVNMMEPLQPQISAQKPNGGLQHPMSDASLVAPNFRAANGRLVQIYMQDIYPDWTYNDLGIDDYLHKVDLMTHEIVADPNHALFVYVPFNEPNNNWYSDNGPRFTKFLHDWMLVYREIRSIDPDAKIAGPGFEHFNGDAFETFLLFARDNHVLPDEFTWHELHDDFFPQWYLRVQTYRTSEAKLGIGPLPIVINEYARNHGDLAVPGNLVQWITRLENSKVYGCLAFWTPSGTLADLTARIRPNRPTGAWWLYQWYGSMTGDTVKVTPPDADAIGLQGIASLDASKQQVRVVFGGTSKPIQLNLRGLEEMAVFRGGVHVSLARIASSGVEPSPEPEKIVEANEYPSGHELLIVVPAAGADSAYSLILTPAISATSGDLPGERLAIDGDLGGKVSVLYSQPKGSAVLLSPAKDGNNASVRFIASVGRDGFYLLRLRYATAAAKNAGLRLVLDDEPPRALILPPVRSGDWAERTLRIFLAAGVHRFRFNAPDENTGTPISLHSLTVTSTEGSIALYQATAPGNILGGTAHKIDLPGAIALHAVEGIGEGPANFLEFKSVEAKASGCYAMVVTYSNEEKGHKGQVDEKTDISVNGAPANTTWFRNTFSGSVFATTVVNLYLKAGENRIRFSNPTGRAPIIESIRIARQDE